MFWVRALICFDRFCSLKSNRFIGTLNWLKKSRNRRAGKIWTEIASDREVSLLQYEKKIFKKHCPAVFFGSSGITQSRRTGTYSLTHKQTHFPRDATLHLPKRVLTSPSWGSSMAVSPKRPPLKCFRPDNCHAVQLMTHTRHALRETLRWSW